MLMVFCSCSRVLLQREIDTEWFRIDVQVRMEYDRESSTRGRRRRVLFMFRLRRFREYRGLPLQERTKAAIFDEQLCRSHANVRNIRKSYSNIFSSAYHVGPIRAEVCSVVFCPHVFCDSMYRPVLFKLFDSIRLHHSFKLYWKSGRMMVQFSATSSSNERFPWIIFWPRFVDNKDGMFWSRCRKSVLSPGLAYFV